VPIVRTAAGGIIGGIAGALTGLIAGAKIGEEDDKRVIRVYRFNQCGLIFLALGGQSQVAKNVTYALNVSEVPSHLVARIIAENAPKRPSYSE
jgi:hypothetical protein